jgi:serine O-acetyltransferase
MKKTATWMALAEACAGIVQTAPMLRRALCETAIDVQPVDGLAALLGRVLHPVWLPAAELAFIASEQFHADADLVDAALDDLSAITTRNLETGGSAWTWLGHRGFHILVAHRVIHALWTKARQAEALAVKAALGNPAMPKAGHRFPFGYSPRPSNEVL